MNVLKLHVEGQNRALPTKSPPKSNCSVVLKLQTAKSGSTQAQFGSPLVLPPRRRMRLAWPVKCAPISASTSAWRNGGTWRCRSGSSCRQQAAAALPEDEEIVWDSGVAGCGSAQQVSACAGGRHGAAKRCRRTGPGKELGAKG
ncbi:hypothetical protein BS78_07G140700 [Paspalum vaginatum]|nr:hypothetical protein BS78_07G140700 [Paspalum vaginatum]